MNAMQKAAWTELAVVAAATIGFLCLLPTMGDRAAGMFGLLGLLPLSMLWLRRRGDAVVTDERDAEIQQRAWFFGAHTAWMLSLMTLIVFVLWVSPNNDGVVRASWLNWLVWTQMLVCYGVKALYSVVAYGGLSRAA